MESELRDIEKDIESLDTINKWYRRYGSTNSYHEIIKAKLCFIGIDEGLIAIPETEVDDPSSRSGKGYVDVVWFVDGYGPVCGFEIDCTIKKNSIRKLNKLHDANKVIVSMGRRENRIMRRVREAEDFDTSNEDHFHISPHIGRP